MSAPNDIDLHLQCGKHGWSQATIWIDGVAKEFTMTHVFSDPLAAICASATELATGAQESTFFWHDEPGTYLWRFSRIKDQHHLLNVTIREFSEIIHHEPSRDAIETINFDVARDFWIQQIISELEKISKLLSYPHYQKGRTKHEFPSAMYGNLCASFNQHFKKVNA